MVHVRWMSWVLVFFALIAALRVTAGGPDRAVFPFVRGTTWTYAATVEWTAVNGNRRGTSEVRFTSRVADAFDDGHVSAALLDGAVWDLAWWTRGTLRTSYALFRVGSRYYVVRDQAKAVFATAKRSGGKALPPHLAENGWFDVPLTPGRVLRPPDFGPRDDTMYGWLIARSAGASGFDLTYRTLPSDETVTVVPGAGITAFSYVHHGTAAEVHARLIAYHRGRAR